MRELSRINPEFLNNQVIKRKSTEDNPGNENSVPQLKLRVENLENLLAVKSYSTGN